MKIAAQASKQLTCCRLSSLGRRYNKKKTEEVEALKLHLGSMKLGNSVDIRLEATELPKIEPYAVVELEEAVYSPYVQRGNFPVLVERITCKGIRSISSKQV